MTSTDDLAARSSFSRGLRLGVPYASVAFLVSLSFGVLARQAGFSVLQSILTSALVFAGSAQFAALSIMTAGGGMVAALSAASMMNSRFLAMGVALAPSLPGRAPARALQAQAVVDSSWALASRGDGTFDRWLLFGTTAPQYLAWFGGTVLGAALGTVLGDTETLGFDALFPTFFVGLLLIELRRPRARVAAGLGVLVALALVPFTPPGVPILAAGAAALVGLAR